MSFYVKCDFCIECKRLELQKNSLAGICQRSGQVKRWFDVGRCIGRARRDPEEVKKLVSDFVKRSTSKNGSRISGISSPALSKYIPIHENGFVGYHVVEERRRSRSRSSLTVDTGSLSGGEKP